MNLFRYVFVVILTFFLNFLKAEEKVNYFDYNVFNHIRLNNSAIFEIIETQGEIDGLKQLLGKRLKKIEGSTKKILLKDKRNGILVSLDKEKPAYEKVISVKLYGKNSKLNIIKKEFKLGASINDFPKEIKTSTKGDHKYIIIKNIEKKGDNLILLFDEDDKLSEINYNKE